LLPIIGIKLRIMNLETLEKYTSSLFTVAPRVWGKKELFVNYYMIQDEQSGNWALVDAGLKWSASRIKAMAQELFGDKKPAAIILTHGHFDHVGALDALADEWQIPVYAHEMEMPYLTGKSSYPPPDPGVGGGGMSVMSFMYPTGPINVSRHVRTLPYDGTIPGFPEWRSIHTPGHSPGHVSLFRQSDKVLIAGDAFVTTKPESVIHSLASTKCLSGPPKYLTCNWASAKQSVVKLEGLNAEIAATGHGKPMRGEELRAEMRQLAANFDEVAVPAFGRYVKEPAVTNQDGVQYLPPATEKITALIKVLGVTLAIASVALVIFQQTQKAKTRREKLTEVLKMQYN
jgi:glyoxylase-like metal-dependent hydrolase (beta-lactamase superfamily II)